MEVILKERNLTLEEWDSIITSVDFIPADLSEVKDIQSNSWLVLCAEDKNNNKLLGFIRVIGDGKHVFFVSDLAVYPQYQNNKIGSRLLEEVIKRVKFSGVSPRIYLCSTVGREEFYESFGFITRPTENLGAGMIKFV